MSQILSFIFFISSLQTSDKAKVLLQNSIKKTYDSCNIVIYSSFGCYDDIKFMNNGRVCIKTMLDKRFNAAENEGKSDSLIDNFCFQIISKSDRLQINKIIAIAKSKPKHKTNPMADAYRFVMLVDGEKLFDIYGQNDEIDKISDLLIKYLRGKFKDRCGFLSNFSTWHRHII